MRQIPPGGEGKITLKVNTNGYAGQRIRESARIQTNDKTRPWLSVTVTGLVEKFADVRPESIRLVGPVGTPLVAEVEITPRKEYPFTVRNVKAKTGRFIKYEVKERCADGRNRCVIRVENTRKDKGRYVDLIQVRTDSPLRREISLFVIGVIQ